MRRKVNHTIIRLVVAFFVLTFSNVAVSETVRDSFNQQVPEKLDGLVSKAREMRIKNFGAAYDIEKSIEILENVVKEKPDYYRAFFNLALSYSKQNGEDIGRINSTFDKAIAISSNPANNIVDGSIYNSAGYINLQSRNYKMSENYLLNCLKFESTNSGWTNAAVYYNLGRLNYELGNYSKSKKYLDIAHSKYHNPIAENLLRVVDYALKRKS